MFRVSGWSNTGFFNYILVAILGVILAQTNVFGKISLLLNKRYALKTIFFIIALGIMFFCLLLNKQVRYQDVVFIVSVAIIAFIEAEYLSKIKPLEKILSFFGKHSMNIFLTHTFIKTYFLHDFIYSFKYGILIFLALLAIMTIISIAIEILKKLLQVENLINFINNKIDKV